LANIFPFGNPELGNFSAPVYFNGYVYFSPIADNLQAFRVTNGLLSTAPTSRSPELYSYPGGTMAVSSGGITNGIVWAIQINGTSGAGVLRAYNAANLGVELYNSTQAGSRDALDPAAKFSLPLIANGKVFAASSGRLTVFGLLP
jgi:outer membrane protein assembly factor BamB